MKYYDRFGLASLEVGQQKEIPFTVAAYPTVSSGVYAFNGHYPDRRIKTKSLYKKNVRVGTIAIRVK